MKPKQHMEFSAGLDFLRLNQELADVTSGHSDAMIENAGVKLPKSARALGNVLSLMYRAACCAWGCDDGDHVLEWLTGRLVNQAISAHRLIRAGSYDEALMLIRGTGEAANLLWLFDQDHVQLERWKSAGRRERLNEFGPGAVRTKLEALVGNVIPIDRDRYQALCEVGTHPVPGVAPGHFTGTGRPILVGGIQEAGVFVCMTELGYAVSMCSVPLARLIELPGDVREEFWAQGRDILANLGAFNVLNYNELLEKVWAERSLDGGVEGQRVEFVGTGHTADLDAPSEEHE